MKYIAIIVGVVILLGIGAWAITRTDDGANEATADPSDTTASESTNQGDPQTDPDQNNQNGSPEITFTSSGFSPETVAIEPGTTVTWTNESDGQMWVASSVHPTHGDLPEFDQREGVGTGETYSYQFDRKGEWSFHNHLAPSHKGTVIVE